MIQLPNDARSEGYKKTGAFTFEQVFSSASANFTGTEKEFVKAGHAYAYTDIGNFKRMVLPSK